jgi:GntR family transcriptional regulator of arabinose operon/LacI family transcriptional regulator
VSVSQRIVREPKYSRVKEFLLGKLSGNQLRPGDPLPTETVLAETLGVGRNTVRQAMAELSNDGIVERIQGKGTFISRQAQRLYGQELAVFALIVPWLQGSLYTSLVKGFGEAAEAINHAVLVCDTEADVRGQSDAIIRAIDRRVAGVAMVPIAEPTPEYQLRHLRQNDIPVVFCHRGPGDKSVPIITWSWKEVGERAARMIAEQGHRRVAFLAWLRYEVTEAYEQAFRATLHEIGIELPENRVHYNAALVDPRQPNISDLPDDDGAHRALAAMLRSEDRPTAVFTHDIEGAERVYLEAVHSGLRVPEDLSIVTFGGKLCGGAIGQRLTTITIDEVEMGRRAVRLLEEIVNGRVAEQSLEPVLMPLEVASGQTLAAPGGLGGSPKE